MKYLMTMVLFCSMISLANADVEKTRIVKRDHPVVREKVDVRIWHPLQRLRVRVNTPAVKVEVGK